MAKKAEDLDVPSTAAVEKAEDESGGWRYDFIGEVPNDFLCVICLLPMKNPVQISSCGHCMCELCSKRVLNSTSQCPQDREPVSKSDVFKDKRMERSIMSLKIRCPNSGRECDWTGELVDLLKKHLETCKKEPIPCSRKQCTAQPLREVFDWHLALECEWRTVSCEHCSMEMLAGDLKAHIEADCLELPVPCNNGCGTTIPRKQMESHAHQCPDGVVLCKYSEVGCCEKLKSKDMESHRKLMQEEHMDQLLNALLTFKAENERKVKELEEENQSLKRELEGSMKNWQEENQRLRSEIESLKPQLGIIPIIETKSSFEPFVCFIWKIDDARKHLKMIEADTEYRIRSDTFSTGTKGYQAQIFLVQDPNDPKQKNLHFQIVKGEYDDILPWPCKLCVESIIHNKSKFKFFVAKKNLEPFYRPVDSVLTVKGSQQLRMLSHYDALKKDGSIIDGSLCIDIRMTKFCAEERHSSMRSYSVS